VDYAVTVRVTQRPADLCQNAMDHRDRELPELPHDRVERSSFDELDDAEQQAIDLVDGVDGDDVRMTQPSGGAGLALEPLDHPGAMEHRRRHDLDGDLAIEADLVREVHGGHAAASEFAVDVVRPERSLPKALEELLGGALLGRD